MRNVKFITERGLVGELRLDSTEPWGGFGDILAEAASVMKQDMESDWVMVEEGEGDNRYEQKIFRGWFESRGLLDIPIRNK